MSATIHSRSFLPKLLAKYVTRNVINGVDFIQAKSFFFTGVCLIIDISGFTALSGAFCDAGKKGIDQLQVSTNGYIGDLVAVVHRWGGDIMKFAGDALICVFAGDFDELSRPTHASERRDGLLGIMLRAMKCAEEVRGIRTDRLTVHVGMSCGELCFGILGGAENRWKSLISGPCIHDLSQCLDEAPSMQVVIAQSCCSELRNCAESSNEVQGEDTTEHEATFAGKEGPVTMRFRKLPSGNVTLVSLSGEVSVPLDNIDEITDEQASKVESLIQQFVPPSIVEELDSATGLSYFAEIREVVTMFMKWDSYEGGAKYRDLIELQPCLYQAQRILHTTGAYLRQFLVDDKGCVLIACWGMPRLSYLDNAHRALSAAAQIRRELERLGMMTSVGITSGDVYCGTVGSIDRMEYAAIGSEVNMAARVMSKAKGRLLVSQSAYNRLSQTDHRLLKAIDPMMVKGRVLPLQAYEYTGSRSASAMLTIGRTTPASEQVPAYCQAALLGMLDSIREPVKSPLRNSLLGRPFSAKGSRHAGSARSFTMSNVVTWGNYASNPAQVILIEGLAGTGKSGAINWLQATAAERGVNVLSVRMVKKVGPKTPLTLWKKMYGLLTAKVIDAREGNVNAPWEYFQELCTAVFPDLTLVKDAVPLITLADAVGVRGIAQENVTIPLGFSLASSSGEKASPHRKKPAAEVKDEDVRDALIKIFAHLLNDQQKLVILENIHHAGKRCLDLLVHLLPHLTHPTAMVLTALIADAPPAAAPVATPMPGEMPRRLARQTSIVTADKAAIVHANTLQDLPWYRTARGRMIRRKNVSVVTLTSYTPSDVEAIMRAALEVTTVPPELLNLVLDFSGGSNFWVREIAQFVKEHGAQQFLSAVGESAGSQSTSISGPGALRRQISGMAAPTLHARDRTPSKGSFQRMPSFQGAISHRVVSTTHEAQLDKLVLCRFGGLVPDAQRVLRAASVIGESFAIDVLCEILPPHLQETLADSLHALVQHRWIYQDAENSDLYIFTHPHSQQVIYELTPASERNGLYAQIAETVEKFHGGDALYFAALSRYFAHCDTNKALQYLIKAQAVQLKVSTFYDFAEAVDLLCSSLPICTSSAAIAAVTELVALCRRSIQGYRHNPNSSETNKAGVLQTLARLFTPCRLNARSTAYVTPISGAKSSHGAEEPRVPTVVLDAENLPPDDLSDPEKQARAIFLRQLEKFSSQLTDVRDSMEEAEKKAVNVVK